MDTDQPNLETTSPSQKYLIPPVTAQNEENKRYTRRKSPPPPPPPVVSARLLEGEPLTFQEFLNDADCAAYIALLFGEDGTSAATMIMEFRKATEFHYFGHRSCKPGRRPPKNPGLLNTENSARKRALKEFARRAYRFDPERRGQIFWQRMATLIWNACASINALRAQSNRIKHREEDRIFGLTAKRLKGAARVNAYRARQKAKFIAKLDAQRDA
jgi:hypothetical protein